MDVTALRNCGLLFLAGGAGALARYGVSELANTLVGRQYPLGTFVVNVLGCFLFGLIWELAAVRLLISDTVRLIILVGFMGSFTTFSSGPAAVQYRRPDHPGLRGPFPGHDRGQALVGPARFSAPLPPSAARAGVPPASDRPCPGARPRPAPPRWC